MRKIRMSELPVLEEIKNEYVELRQQGSNRVTAVQKLMESYRYELSDMDEAAQLFWIGLADAQYYWKELTEEVGRKGLEALNMVERCEWHVASSDIKRRRENYAKAPMPERKACKPQSKFRCTWQLGDTFAFQLVSQHAQNIGYLGQYVLLRKVAEAECRGGIYPVVMVSLCNGEVLPMNEESFRSLPLIKLQSGGRCFSPKDKFEYRTVIYAKSDKQLRSLPLTYCGRFVNVSNPPDEIIFSRFGEIMITLAESLEQDLCHYIQNNARIMLKELQD